MKSKIQKYIVPVVFTTEGIDSFCFITGGIRITEEGKTEPSYYESGSFEKGYGRLIKLKAMKPNIVNKSFWIKIDHPEIPAKEACLIMLNESRWWK